MPGKRMVWIFNHYAVPPDAAGPTRHFDLARSLVQKGYRVCIFASAFDHVTHKLNRLNAGEKVKLQAVEGVIFVWLRTFPYMKNDWRRVLNMFSYAWSVLTAGARQFNEKPDVIIGSSMHPPAVIVAFILARKYRCKFFFEVRDLWPQTAVDMGKLKASGWVARVLYTWEKFMYKKSDRIIVVLPKAVDYICRLGVPKGKVVWIPNGVNLKRFDAVFSLYKNQSIMSEINEMKNGKGKYIVIYTGAHGPANGVDLLLETAGIVADLDNEIHFVLVGDGPEKDRLIQKSIDHNLHNVSFFAAVPKQMVPGILSTADILVNCLRPLKVYRWGISVNKVFDYFASGKPMVFAMDVPNDLVKQAKAGITVMPEDAEAMARAIIDLKNMPEQERGQLGLNGRRFVEQYYSTEKLARSLERVICDEYR